MLDQVLALPDGSRVAIDGVDASGKTTLADGFAAASPRVSRTSLDDFHHPVEVRYARGRDDPEGCYRDTFDLAAFRTAVEQPVSGLLVVDGVFLRRPELADLWDLVVLLVIDDEEVVRRARRRDAGDRDEIERRYRARYLPAQRIYRAEAARPPDLVVDNTDPAAPRLLGTSAI